MKFAKFLMFSFMLAGAASFAACGGNTATDSEAKMGKEHTSGYVCPMHCEGSGSDAAGTCPVCGMDYVANAEHKKDGHNH